MLSSFDRVVTFSRGIMRHKAIHHMYENRLRFALRELAENTCVVGWGNKKNTLKPQKLAKKYNKPFLRLEDGFIRSVGLGVKGTPSCSFVVDDLGIYYDATTPSRLEKILSQYEFEHDIQLIETAEQAIELIRKFKISKYNLPTSSIPNTLTDGSAKKILVVAQTAGDLSLQYGSGNHFSTQQLIQAAFEENPGAEVFLKIHPDVIAGKRKSDINPAQIPPTCQVITQDINPISILEKIDKVYTKTSQMGFEALLLGKECVCFGIPFYSGWGLTDDRVPCPRRNRKLTATQIFAGAYILYTTYFNPYLNKKSDIIDIIYTIKRYREIEKTNGSALLLHGFPAWKRFCHLHFFKSYQKNAMIFCPTTDKVKAEMQRTNAKLLVWSRPDNAQLKTEIQQQDWETFYVEDGFIRSVALGSDLTTPYSLVVDSRGLYFDPTCESDLENIYNTYNFQSHSGLLDRAQDLIEIIVTARLSKYNCAPHKTISIDKASFDKVILIPGQVADDASIRLGGFGMSNLQLIEVVRHNNPTSYIIYKPHPDVVAGNRAGHLPPQTVGKYCDLTVTDMSIDSCIHCADEIHTITSLSGFDAILRGKKVYTYGIPFYAGWGLTEDLRNCHRRIRQLTRQELVAGALLLYPRYIHPVSKEFCEIEIVLEEIARKQDLLLSSPTYRRMKQLRNRSITLSKKVLGFLK